MTEQEKCPKCGMAHRYEYGLESNGDQFYVVVGVKPKELIAHNVPKDAVRLIGYHLTERMCLAARIAELEAIVDTLQQKNTALNIALFHVDNGLGHPDERVRLLIQAAEAAKEQP